MTEAEKKDLVIREGFEGLHDEHKTWKALVTLVERLKANEIVAVANPMLTAEQHTFNAGRVAMLLEVENQLKGQRKRAARGGEGPTKV